jgi:hypothetical protein
MKPEDKKRLQHALCNQCAKPVNLEENAKKVDMGDEAPGVFEIGIECPHCGYWIHACFMTSQLDRYRAVMHDKQRLHNVHRTAGTAKDLLRAKQKFQEKFDAVQVKYRAQFGRVGPRQVMAQEAAAMPAS